MSDGRRIGTFATGAVIAATAALYCPSGVATGFAAGAPASAPRVTYSASAYGTKVDAGAIFHSGPTALIGLDCRAKAGDEHSNTVATVSLPPLIGTGTVTSVVSATEEAGTDAANAESTIQSVNLLDGMITADSIDATAVTSLTGGTLATTGTTTLAGLTVAGNPVGESPAPNTQFALPGVGTVTLNEQESTIDADSASLVVTAIDIHVAKGNTLGLKTGSRIIVGHPRSGIGNVSERALIDGHGFGSTLNVGTVVVSGRSAYRPLPCVGTDGNVLTNSTAAVTIPGALSTGTVTSTAEARIGDSHSNGETTNTIQDVAVLPVSLSALLTATTVKAVAHIRDVNGTLTFKDTGSKFTGLHVQGFPTIAGDVPPNTTLDIPGVGTLYLHRVIQTAHGIEVRMIELVVTATGAPLPVGSDLIVSDAKIAIP
jgi:hypothetical protein